MTVLRLHGRRDDVLTHSRVRSLVCPRYRSLSTKGELRVERKDYATISLRLAVIQAHGSQAVLPQPSLQRPHWPWEGRRPAQAAASARWRTTRVDHRESSGAESGREHERGGWGRVLKALEATEGPARPHRVPPATAAASAYFLSLWPLRGEKGFSGGEAAPASRPFVAVASTLPAAQTVTQLA